MPTGDTRLAFGIAGPGRQTDPVQRAVAVFIVGDHLVRFPAIRAIAILQKAPGIEIPVIVGAIFSIVFNVQIPAKVAGTVKMPGMMVQSHKQYKMLIPCPGKTPAMLKGDGRSVTVPDGRLSLRAMRVGRRVIRLPRLAAGMCSS